MFLRLSSVQKSPFIGAYAAVGIRRALIYPSAPQGFERLLRDTLNVEIRRGTIGTVSVVGYMVSFNSRGAVVPHTANEEETAVLSDLGLEVYRVPHSLLAWGNLMSTNDRGAIFSEIVPRDIAATIADRLDVDYDFLSPAGYRVCGSFIAASNAWALISNSFSEDQVVTIRDLLKVRVAVGTINADCTQVKLGALVSDTGILLGKDTTGPEIMEIQGALS